MAKSSTALKPAQARRVSAAYAAGKLNSEQAAQRLFKPGAVSRVAVARAYYAAEAEAGTLKPVKATPAGVKKARDVGKLRWRRIAIAAGITEAEARRLYAAAGGDPAASYCGRGRNYTAK